MKFPKFLISDKGAAKWIGRIGHLRSVLRVGFAPVGPILWERYLITVPTPPQVGEAFWKGQIAVRGDSRPFRRIEILLHRTRSF